MNVKKNGATELHPYNGASAIPRYLLRKMDFRFCRIGCPIEPSEHRKKVPKRLIQRKREWKKQKAEIQLDFQLISNEMKPSTDNSWAAKVFKELGRNRKLNKEARKVMVCNQALFYGLQMFLKVGFEQKLAYSMLLGRLQQQGTKYRKNFRFPSISFAWHTHSEKR